MLCFDLVAWDWRILPRGSREHFYPETRFMERVRAEESAEPGAYRAVGQDLLVYPSLLTVYGAADPRPYNPLAPKAQLAALEAAFDYRRQVAHYFSPLRHLEHPLLDFLAVRTVVSNAYLPPVARLERIDHGEALPQPFVLLRNPHALARWFLATRVDRVPRAALRAFLAELDEGAHVAVFADEAPSLAPALSAGRVTTIAQRPGALRLAVTARGAALLATSLPGPAGWRATVDGRAVTPLTLNGAFLGVPLPDGVREVRLDFTPPGLLAGGLCALVALAILVALSLLPRSRHDAAP